MAEKSTIEWLCGNDGSAGATWNPLVGCSKVSAGCRNCYAIRQAVRLAGNPATPQYHGTIGRSSGKPTWSGVVNVAPGHVLTQPLRWRKPRRIFVNSMSDLFHEAVPDEAIDRIFSVMALCPQHTFIVLTKRPKRMRSWVTRLAEIDYALEAICDASVAITGSPCAANIIEDVCIPLPNVWLGVSVEDQETADERIPELLATPAAVRVVSAEPLLGPVDLRPWLTEWWRGVLSSHQPMGSAILVADIDGLPVEGVDWVIAGGESGPGARPADPAWFRDIRDQCQNVGVEFFMKQMSGVRKSAMPPIPDDLMIREWPR